MRWDLFGCWRLGRALLRAAYATEQKSRAGRHTCAVAGGLLRWEIAFAENEGTTRWNVPLTCAPNCAKLTRRCWWRPPSLSMRGHVAYAQFDGLAAHSTSTPHFETIFFRARIHLGKTQKVRARDIFNNFISGIFARYKTLNGQREVIASYDNMKHWEFIFPQKIYVYIFSIFSVSNFLVSIASFFEFFSFVAAGINQSNAGTTRNARTQTAGTVK